MTYDNNDGPIYSMLSGKYPNGFVLTGVPSSWNQIGSSNPNNLTYGQYGYCGGGWCDNDYGDYSFKYITDWPCNCDPTRRPRLPPIEPPLISGWFFWGGYGPSAFASGSPDSPPSSGWQEWGYTESCSNNNISACGGGSQTFNLTFTPV
jgi:hypothetical protein